jgi:alcohol dehydrogenase
MRSLREAGVEVTHFAGAVPNPTTESVSAGATAARGGRIDIALGLGGGSSIDTAKAIAVEATHPGAAWDYLYFKQSPTDKTLPVVAVPTTSGTGSHVTQVAVLTETATKTKSAIFHPRVYPRISIVDPDLMSTVPRDVTASTGFDVFAHAFLSSRERLAHHEPDGSRGHAHCWRLPPTRGERRDGPRSPGDDGGG